MSTVYSRPLSSNCVATSSNIFFFFFQAEDGIRDGHVTGVQTCALPICRQRTPIPHRGDVHVPERLLEQVVHGRGRPGAAVDAVGDRADRHLGDVEAGVELLEHATGEDRKSTRLNSSHVAISYAVFCLKKKKTQ